jgi:hypothetical protein
VRSGIRTTAAGRVVWTKVAESAAERARLTQERAVLGSVRHPNLVELVLDAPDDGTDSLTTVYCARATLASDRPSTIERLAEVAEALLVVVGELHSMGWAHGALTPEHCLLTADGRLVLCSLGRASRITERTHPRARADRDAVRKMIAEWDSSLSRPRTRKDREARARLQRTVAASGATIPLFRRAGAPVVSSAPSDDPVPRSAEAATHRRAVFGAGVRLLTFALVLVGASVARVPPPGTSDPLVATIASWTIAVARPLAVYGMAVSALCLAGLLTRRDRLIRASGRLAPRWLHRMVTGLAVAGALSSAVAPSGRSVEQHHAVVAERDAPGDIAAPVVEPPSSTIAPTTTLGPVSTPLIRPSTSAATSTAADLPIEKATATWTVRHGDHFWRVAELSLAAAWGRTPTEREVDAYWRSLVSLNRSRLADPRNPELLYVGQVLELPPIPARSVA